MIEGDRRKFLIPLFIQWMDVLRRCKECEANKQMYQLLCTFDGDLYTYKVGTIKSNRYCIYSSNYEEVTNASSKQ